MQEFTAKRAPINLWRWFIGVVLFYLVVATLMATVVVYSASSFQVFAANTAPGTGGILNISRLLEAESMSLELQRASAEPRGELLQIEGELSELEAQTTRFEAEINDTRVSIAGDLARLEATSGADSSVANSDLTAAALSERFAQTASSLPASAQREAVRVRAHIEGLEELEARVGELDTQKIMLVSRQRLVSGQVAESNRRILAVQQDAVSDPSQFNRLLSGFSALRNLTPLGFGAYLALGDPNLLQLMLAMLGGVLGGLLFLVPAFATRAYPITLGSVLGRVVVGMIGGFVAFLFCNLIFGSFDVGAYSGALVNPVIVAFAGICGGAGADELATIFIARRIKRRIDLGIHAPRVTA